MYARCLFSWWNEPTFRIPQYPIGRATGTELKLADGFSARAIRVKMENQTP